MGSCLRALGVLVEGPVLCTFEWDWLTGSILEMDETNVLIDVLSSLKPDSVSSIDLSAAAVRNQMGCVLVRVRTSFVGDLKNLRDMFMNNDRSVRFSLGNVPPSGICTD